MSHDDMPRTMAELKALRRTLPKRKGGRGGPAPMLDFDAQLAKLKRWSAERPAAYTEVVVPHDELKTPGDLRAVFSDIAASGVAVRLDGRGRIVLESDRAIPKPLSRFVREYSKRIARALKRRKRRR